MSPSRLWCCLDSRSKRLNGTSNEELDERFGDTSISGPISGGWNQTGTAPRTPSNQRSSHTSKSSTFSKTKKWRPGVFRTHSVSTSSPRRSSFGAKDMSLPVKHLDDTSSTATTQEKAPFVYKPASEEFFKNMAEIGKPRHSRQPSRPVVAGQQQQQQSGSREPSIRSTNSMYPDSPGDIPHHPSYQNPPLVVAVESDSPQPKQLPVPAHLATNVLDSMLYPRSFSGAAATNASTRQSLDENGRNADIEKLQFRSATPQIMYDVTTSQQLPQNNSKPKRQMSKRNRVVTQDLVPSTNELFA